MMKNNDKSPRNKTLGSAVLWAITYSACLLILKTWSPDPVLGIILSLLPVAAFAGFLYHLIKGVASMDEVQIRIQMEAAAVGFSLGLLMLMTLGLLDLVVVLNKEDWGYRHLVPYFAIFYFIGLIIAHRKYSWQ